jgi:hypothetical protein
MRIHFERLEPNVAIDDSLFTPSEPPNFEVVPMRRLPPPIDYNLAPGLPPEPDGGSAEEGRA